MCRRITETTPLPVREVEKTESYKCSVCKSKPSAWRSGSQIMISKYGTTGKEISSNLTDNESAKMKTSHGVIQGYNSQALIDDQHQVIIHAEAFGRGQDHAHGPPMLEGALENLQSLGHGAEYFAGKIFTADTNYHSDTNLRKCQELQLNAYIPDIYFRRRDPRYAVTPTAVLAPAEAVCLRGFSLRGGHRPLPVPAGQQTQADSEKSLRRWFGTQNICGRGTRLPALSLTSAVSDAQGGKRKYLRVPIGVELTNFSQRMAGKVDSELGRKIYPQRFAVAEPVFANIRTHKRRYRSTLRGKVKVNIQWLLYCMVHNIEKITHYGST